MFDRQSEFLKTFDYQCGFKPKSSTILCSTMVNETIQYYTENREKRVYVLLLDATKAFDKVFHLNYYLIFSLYVDELFLLLKKSGQGCHVGSQYAGAFGYADDIALIDPFLSSLKQIMKICENFAKSHSIVFNSSKNKAAML